MIGRSPALYDAHKEHYGKDDDDILFWQADTASMNPTISQVYIDKEIEKDPEASRPSRMARVIPRGCLGSIINLTDCWLTSLASLNIGLSMT
jgi:hypothetical protein